MEYPERRNAKRYLVRVPLRFRWFSPPADSEHFGEMLDVSPHGVCFVSTIPLAVGSIVEVFLRLPEGILGRTSDEWRWLGKVVHARSLIALDERTTVGIRFAAGQSVEDSEEYRNRRITGAVAIETKKPVGLFREVRRFDVSGREKR